MGDDFFKGIHEKQKRYEGYKPPQMSDECADWPQTLRNRIAQLEAENKRLREALVRIRRYDAEIIEALDDGKHISLCLDVKSAFGRVIEALKKMGE
jgi:hypothetical protein